MSGAVAESIARIDEMQKSFVFHDWKKINEQRAGWIDDTIGNQDLIRRPRGRPVATSTICSRGTAVPVLHGVLRDPAALAAVGEPSNRCRHDARCDAHTPVS